jgi:hypothetical protein
VVLIVLAMVFLLPPAAPAAASGAIWLPTQQATFTPTNKTVPSLATYRNHAYILWLGDVPPGKTTTQVFFTTNASGTWKTRLLSAAGPGPGGVVEGGPNVFMAVDPSIKRIYAVWADGKSGAGGKPGTGGLVMYTSGDEGTTWQGPTTIVKNSLSSAVDDNLAVAVGGGKAAIAFDGNPHDFGLKPACPGGISDILAVTYNGTAWSRPQDVTSCVAVQSNGFRTQRMAYDQTTKSFSLVALDDTNKYGLWYARSSGTTWSTPVPTPMTHLVTGANNAYDGDYQVAAAGGTTYVAYANLIKPGAAWCCVDVFLGTLRSGQGWAVKRVTQDPLNCQKFDVTLAALPDRIALAYRWGGFCAKPEPSSGPHEEYIHVLTGLPGHLKELVPFKPPIPSSCSRTVLSTDGNVFRLLQTCNNNGVPGGNLFYSPEFDDVVGPITKITSISTTGPGTIRVAWTAQDPTPGTGVAYSAVQVRVDGGAWQPVTASTPATFAVYTHAQAGHTYMLRVRSRDKVNNWGSWVTTTIKIA